MYVHEILRWYLVCYFLFNARKFI